MKKFPQMKFTLPIFLMLASLVRAQTPAAGEDHQLIQQLLDRVRDLESEVKQLRGVPNAAAADPSPQVSSPGPVTAAVAPPPLMQMPVNDASMHDAGIPGMQFRGFSDIDYRASTHDLPNTFLLGQFNLFITSRLSDQFSVLAEVVMEANVENAVGVDLERLLFRYTPNDYFNLSVGRYHTSVGYYNTAFHHAAWMQTTADRPLLFQFEDNGGILPIHNVGLSATGRIPSGSLGLRYLAEVGNGRTFRSPIQEAVQNKQDENNGKSVNIGILARPKALPGFEAGFSIYHDRLYPDGGLKISQNIFSAHAIYEGPRFEFLNEVVVLRHTVDSIHHDFTIPAFYSQISRAFHKVRPYARYEYINVPRAAPLFGDVGLRHGPIAGVRYDFSEFAAYKLEFFRTFQRDLPTINGLRTQVSFTF
jgi:hypothetical protein